LDREFDWDQPDAWGLRFSGVLLLVAALHWGAVTVFSGLLPFGFLSTRNRHTLKHKQPKRT
jgi:hypothetical protein